MAVSLSFGLLSTWQPSSPRASDWREKQKPQQFITQPWKLLTVTSAIFYQSQNNPDTTQEGTTQAHKYQKGSLLGAIIKATYHIQSGRIRESPQRKPRPHGEIEFESQYPSIVHENSQQFSNSLAREGFSCHNLFPSLYA